MKPDTYFRREGYDIIRFLYNNFTSIINLTFSFKDFVVKAVLGHSVEVKTLYGMKQIKVEKGTQHGQKIKLANHVKNILNNRRSIKIFRESPN